jgi:dynein heavy chain
MSSSPASATQLHAAQHMGGATRAALAEAAVAAAAAAAAAVAAGEAGGEGPVGTESDKDLLRYYYYINNGIDTEHVTAMEQEWLDHIHSLLDPSLKARGPALLAELSDDIRDDYLLSVKKSIVDFVLKDPQLDKTAGAATWPAFRDQPELGVVPKPWTESFLTAQETLERQLYLCHPAMGALLQLWHGDFAQVRMIKAADFAKKRGAVDVSVFSKMVSMHIDEARHALQRQWVASAAERVQQLLGSRRGPAVPAPRRDAFLELCSQVMSAQLRSLVMASICEYVDMLCGPADEEDDDMPAAHRASASATGGVASGTFKGFVLRLTLPDDVLTFAPDTDALEAAVIKGIERMVSSVSELARLEYSFSEDARPQGRQRFLTPNVTDDLLEPQLARVRALFASQAGVPTEYLGVYTPYEALITRRAEEELLKFFEGKRPFQEQTREVLRYRRLASTVLYDLGKVATAGIFAIHSEAANTELAQRANGLADRVVARISHEVQVRGHPLTILLLFSDTFPRWGETAPPLPVCTFFLRSSVYPQPPSHLLLLFL